MLKPKPSEIRKPTRTISGITPVAVMLPPRACDHGNCIYCPNLGVPQSYTPKSPVVMRARRVNYDSYMRRGGLRYFKSEAALQLYMYKKNVIGLARLVLNISMRFVIQILMPNRLRKLIFKKFFRAKKG